MLRRLSTSWTQRMSDTLRGWAQVERKGVMHYRLPYSQEDKTPKSVSSLKLKETESLTYAVRSCCRCCCGWWYRNSKISIYDIDYIYIGYQSWRKLVYLLISKIPTPLVQNLDADSYIIGEFYSYTLHSSFLCRQLIPNIPI